MRRTSVYLRPDARDSDLVRVGALYLSRTTDQSKIYISFMPEEGLDTIVASATASEAMRSLMADFGKALMRILPETDPSRQKCEEAIIEAMFGLLPTNLKHDEIEEYPAEDFFVRAIRELDEKALKPEAVADAQACVA